MKRIHLPPLSRRWFVTLLLVLLAAQIYYANKSWRSYQVLAGARALGVADAADLRAYMTPSQLISDFGFTEPALLGRLGADALSGEQTLHQIADQRGESVLGLIADLQQLMPAPQAVQSTEPQTPGLLDRLLDWSVQAVEQYGLPMLAVIILLGALGLPVPAGPLAALAGGLAYESLLDPLLVAIIVLSGSLGGDLLVYLLGRALSPAHLVRYGRWLGYTEQNRLRIEHLFARFGGLTLILTRSLVAHISAVGSLFAGQAQLGLVRFILLDLLGRALWMLGYFGLGFWVGSDFEMASGFLGYLSLLLLSLFAAAMLAYVFANPQRPVRAELPTPG